MQSDGKNIYQSSINQNVKYLIVIFGCPASGKTTFYQHLKHTFTQALFVSADEIQRKFLQFNNDQVIHALSMNNQQTILFAQKLQKQTNSINKKPKFTSQNWKNSRKLFEQIVNKIIVHKSMIIEDDLLLRSQRRVFQKIAYSNKVLYMQIYMNSTLQQCLENMKKRSIESGDNVVNQQVIRKAYDKLQVQQNDMCIHLNLNQKQRNMITKQEIQSKLKLVKIIPNDPNDPYFNIIRPEYQHSFVQNKQIEIRSYIHQLMTLNEHQLIIKFGEQRVKAKNIFSNKKRLAAFLAQWKKSYIKKIKKCLILGKNQDINQDLINFIDQYQN